VHAICLVYSIVGKFSNKRIIGPLEIYNISFSLSLVSEDYCDPLQLKRNKVLGIYIGIERSNGVCSIFPQIASSLSFEVPYIFIDNNNFHLVKNVVPFS